MIGPSIWFVPLHGRHRPVARLAGDKPGGSQEIHPAAQGINSVARRSEFQASGGVYPRRQDRRDKPGGSGDKPGGSQERFPKQRLR
jgi:hypothetical protein